MIDLTVDLAPAYMGARGPKAEAAYRRALKFGTTYDRRVKILLVGQDRVAPIPSSTTEGQQDVQGQTPRGEESITINEKQNQRDSQGLKPGRVDSMPQDMTPLLEEQLQRKELEEDDEIWPVIWDFAGQDIYRAIHPIFMSQDDIYLLVLDITKKLSDRALCQVNVGHGERRVPARDSEDTNLDHILRWLALVHSLKDCDEKEETSSKFSLPSLPPVIVVGTHASSQDPKTDIALIEKNFDCRVIPKELKKHIVKFLPIDNTKAGMEIGQEKILTLRKEILELANKLPHTKKKIPLQWHRVEKEIMKEEWQEMKYLSKETFREKVVLPICNFARDDDFDELVFFLHARGSIVYHEHSGDKEGLVVLDPQWLITVLSEIIKVKHSDNGHPVIKDDRERLKTEGVLTDELLNYACANLQLLSIKDHLISLMEKFNLICTWRANETEDSLHLVPWMLTTKAEEGKADEETTSACFAPLFLTFKGTEYVPSGLFSRLVVLLGRWLSEPHHKHSHQLYANEAHFALNEVYVLRLTRYKTVIRISIEGSPPPPPEHFSDVLSHLEEFLKEHKRECHWLSRMTWIWKAQSTVHSGKNTGACPRHEKEQCRHPDCANYIPLTSRVLCFTPGRPLPLETFKPWIEALKTLHSRDKSGASSSNNFDEPHTTTMETEVSKEVSPSLDALEWLSLRVGDSWEPLARRLGFIDAEITGFHKDKDKYAEKARSMLFRWKEKSAAATYEVLCNALRHEFVGRKDLAKELRRLKLKRHLVT